MGLTWAVGLGGLLTAVGFIVGGIFVPGLAMTGGFMGFIAGSAFAVILSISERKRGLADLSLWRMALWGGLGGALVAASVNIIGGSGGLIWDFLASMALIGAALSTGTVALAKRSGDAKLIEEEEDPMLIEGDDEPLPALEGE